jgi:hypothetical protein
MRNAPMTIVHAVLCEDYGRLDAKAIRNELMAESGIRDVRCEPARNRLLIEYDPALLKYDRLVELMCRHALIADPTLKSER